MCGIAGIINTQETVDISTLETMLSAMSHRGPDDSGLSIQNLVTMSVGLVSTRLSIIDLSSAGHMPMTNQNQDIWIVYNGEIYNHREIRVKLDRKGFSKFASRTDTEVLLYAYEAFGLDCFSMLNGMFAVAIVDHRLERVVLARDRMGIKPLYYFWDGCELVFASELKAIVHHPKINRVINPEALQLYLAFGYVPSPFSMFSGVNKLEPGKILNLQHGNLAKSSFWSPSPSISKDKSLTQRDLVNQTRDALSNSVKRQLMGDVPIGVMLSGGLDSTIVASLAQKNHPMPLHTFSVGFHTATAELEAIYNWDREHAKRVAKDLGTVHHDVIIEDNRALVGKLESAIGALDEPLWEASYLSIYAMSALAREHGVKVLLTGDGSDELFGGYPWYIGAIRMARYERIPFLKPLLLLAEGIMPAGSLQDRIVDVIDRYRQPAHVRYLSDHQQLRGEMRSALTHEKMDGTSVLVNYIEPLLDPVRNATPADQSAFADQLLWVREHFNHRIDRMTMRASIEGRVPFQDNEVVDLAMSISMKHKIVRGVRKSLLVEAFRQDIPKAVIARPKRPFAAPAKAWLQGSLKDYALETLSQSSVYELGFLDGKSVESFAHPYLRRGFSNSRDLPGLRAVWNLFTLCVWARQVLVVR